MGRAAEVKKKIQEMKVAKVKKATILKKKVTGAGPASAHRAGMCEPTGMPYAHTRTGSFTAGMPKIIAQYTVKKGDTISQIAKSYYGFSSKPCWKLIQEANKDIIKDVNLIKPGQVIKIPVLPEELKKK